MFFNRAMAVWAAVTAHFGDQARAASKMMLNKDAGGFIHPRYTGLRRDWLNGVTAGYPPNGERECARRAKRFNPHSSNGF